jgi:thiol-disulfide isomerase/thioredoxin
MLRAYTALAFGVAATFTVATFAHAQGSAQSTSSASSASASSASAAGTTASSASSSSKADGDSVVWNELSSHMGDLRGKLPQLLKERMDSAHAQGRTMFVEVGATWCGPCLELEANLKKPEFIDAFAGTSIVHLDANEWDVEEDMGPIGITGGVMPIIIAMDPKTPKATKQLNGVIDAAGIKKFLDAHRWPTVASESGTPTGTSTASATKK